MDIDVFPSVVIVAGKARDLFYKLVGGPSPARSAGPIPGLTFNLGEKIMCKGKYRKQSLCRPLWTEDVMEEVIAFAAAGDTGLANGFPFVKQQDPALVSHLFEQMGQPLYHGQVGLGVPTDQGVCFVKRHFPVMEDRRKLMGRDFFAQKGIFQGPGKGSGVKSLVFFQCSLVGGNHHIFMGHGRQNGPESVGDILRDKFGDGLILGRPP